MVIARSGLPFRHRRGQLDRQLALPHQNADQRVQHRFGQRVAQERRIDAVARRIALGDHPAVVQHDHGLGAPIWRPIGLGEGAVERRGEARIARCHDIRTGDLRQDRYALRLDRVPRRWRERVVARHQAAEIVAIGRAALEAASEGRAHRPLRRVDLVPDGPIDQPHHGHCLKGVGVDAVRRLAGAEGSQAEEAADGAGRHPDRGAWAGGAGGEAGRGGDEDQLAQDRSHDECSRC
jgi:hypothetical protein